MFFFTNYTYLPPKVFLNKTNTPPLIFPKPLPPFNLLHCFTNVIKTSLKWYSLLFFTTVYLDSIFLMFTCKTKVFRVPLSPLTLLNVEGQGRIPRQELNPHIECSSTQPSKHLTTCKELMIETQQTCQNTSKIAHDWIY